MALSEDAKKLLNGGEGIEVEYKTNVGRDFNDTLVAFANGSGGIVLFGVEDAKDEKGRHIGKVVGIEISDKNKAKIQSQANSMVDPIVIKIESETDDDGKGIYKVLIKEGENKPYCTGGGRYLVRSDGQNCPITPTMMARFYERRLNIAVSPEKQLLMKDLEILKNILEIGLNDARGMFPPFYQYSSSGMFRDDKGLENLVSNLALRGVDQKLINECHLFIDTTQNYAREWFEAGNILRQRQAEDPLYGKYYPAREEIVEEFKRNHNGEFYVHRMGLHYTNICKQMEEILG